MGVSSCAQDAGLQRRHRVTQPFMLIADGRFRGYKSRSIAEPKEWPQCVRNVLGSTCAKHIPTFFYSATQQQESSDAKGHVSIVLLRAMWEKASSRTMLR